MGGTGSLFTDAGAITYLTSTADSLALGGINSSAPFYFDEGNELLTLTNTTAGVSFRVNDQASDTTPFVIDASGNVGIGTATPAAKLDIAGSSSTISNTAGDITIDSNSGYISFAGDSLSNVLNATFSGNVIINGGQIQLPNQATNPTSIGEGSIIYNSTDKKLYYAKDTGWADVGKVYVGTANQTFRHNGTDWEASSAFQNDGTNVTATGQVRVGNYVTKPTGIGAGAMVYDTTLGSLFVYDGATWRAISTSQMFSTNGSVADGSYLQITHNLNSFDLISSAWVQVGSQWQEATDSSRAVLHNLDNVLNPEYNAKKKVSTVALNYNGNNFGTGGDGAITIGSDTSINTTNSITGRTCTDGGDAVNYSVTALTSLTATLESSPSTGCLVAGDEVLLINLQGSASAYANVGNYETLRISSISTNTITFTSAKTKYYGANAGDDTSIGLSLGNQIVMLQRVPNYTSVSISGSGTDFTPDDWVSPTGVVNNGAGEGGIMFFRATGTVTVGTGSTINADWKGYIGGAGGPAAGGTGGLTGESYNGKTGNGGPGETNGGGRAAAGAISSPNDGAIQGGGGGGGISGCYGCDETGGGGGGGGYAGGGGGGGGGDRSNSVGGAGGTGGAVGVAGGGGGGASGSATGGAGGNAGSAGTGGDLGAGGQVGSGATSGSGGGGAGNGNDYGGGGGGGGGFYGTADLSTMFFGGAGAGGGRSYGGPVNGEAGGDGGGIVSISAGTINNSGVITSTGGNGGASTVGGNGGAGAGGSIKLVGSTLTLGTTTVTAIGGTVAGGDGGDGGDGGNGRIAIYYSTSFSGSTNPAYGVAAVISGYSYSMFVSN